MSWGDKVYKAIEKENYVLADSLLTEWHSAVGNDPELMIARFNRYINQSRNTFLRLTDELSSEGDAMMFSDSLGNVVGSIQQGVQWNDSLYDNAINVINEAVERYPNRLDMRLGYAAALSMRQRHAELADVLKAMMAYADSNNYEWFWQNGERLNDGRNEMIESVWEYNTSIYNREDDKVAFELASEALKYFPEDLRFINLCGGLKYFEGAYPEALEYFNRALAIIPDDEIVISNIAQVNFVTGHYDETIKNCDRILSKSGADENIKAFAENLKTNALEKMKEK